MKQKLITLTACAAMIAAVSVGAAEAPAADDGGGPRHRDHKWGNSLERVTKTLDLTPDQEAKIRPIFAQTRPQMQAARQEFRGKMSATRDNIRSQVRPLLTAAQQQKLDEIRNAREAKDPAQQDFV